MIRDKNQNLQLIFYEDRMDSFKILVQGYARQGESGKVFYASCTSTLIISNGLKVLIDPGADKKALLEGLTKEGFKPSDIDIVFLTHYHPDHFLNIQLFPEYKIYDATTIWENDGKETFPNQDKPMDVIPGTSVKILATPGHREEHCSLLIETKDQGKVCIAQDVFWWEDGTQPEKPSVEELLNLEDPYLADKEDLLKSRKLVLEKADWIVPGHGAMFRNPSSQH